MKYVVMLLILMGLTGMAYASDDDTSHPDMKTIEEHYEVEIIGLKDQYVTGERYSFYFVISGYGFSCANYQANYPDENGSIVGTGAEVLCTPDESKHEFEINYSDMKGTLGNVGIKKPGIYTVTVTFEKPNKYFPITVSKEFHVVDSIDKNTNKLNPLKQFKSGVSIDEIQCRENFSLILKYDGSPACVKPETKTKLIERDWIKSDNTVIINWKK